MMRAVRLGGGLGGGGGRGEGKDFIFGGVRVLGWLWVVGRRGGRRVNVHLIVM